MSQMRQQASAVLNAMDEARVISIITLIDAGYLATDPAKSRRDNIDAYCTVLGVKDSAYWLDESFAHLTKKD